MIATQKGYNRVIDDVEAILVTVEVEMSYAVQYILDSFEQLTALEKQEFVVEIIRRAATLDFPPVSDDELTLAAESLFLELDERENRDQDQSG